MYKFEGKKFEGFFYNLVEEVTSIVEKISRDSFEVKHVRKMMNVNSTDRSKIILIYKALCYLEFIDFLTSEKGNGHRKFKIKKKL